jgi:hypothetical protein
MSARTGNSAVTSVRETVCKSVSSPGLRASFAQTAFQLKILKIDDAGLPKQFTHYTFHVMKRLPDQRGLCDEHNVKPGFEVGMKLLDRRAQKAPGPVTNDRLAESLPGDKAITVMRQCVGSQADRHGSMVIRTAFPA